MLVHGTLPRFYLDSLDKETIQGKAIPSKGIKFFDNFYLNSQFGVEDPVIIESDRQFLAIIGTPFYKNKHLTEIEDLPLLERILSNSIQEIDSCFFIISYKKYEKSLTLYTDRFGTYVVFFLVLNNFVAFSTSIDSLYSLLRCHKKPELNNETIFEFMWFRRLFGDKTYIKDIRTLPPASLCSFQFGKSFQFNAYWTPKPSQSSIQRNPNEWAESIESSIVQGTRLSISDDDKHALMLSGGLDSRALLSVGREKYLSVTNSPSKNQEYLVAKQLADIVGSKHLHILRPVNYVDVIFEDAISHSNGMTLYYESQFLGYKDLLTGLADHVHMGLFLDVFFCGHYMPKRHHSIQNRNTHYFVLDKLTEQNFEADFCNNVSYRQKFTALDKVVRPAEYQTGYDSITNEIKAILTKGRDEGFFGVELWEYLHLSNLGRHYSMLMARSLRPFVNVQIPALTIDNYNLAFQLPVASKYNWTAYLQALNRLDPALMGVINSNTSNPAKDGLYVQTLKKGMKGLANIIRPGSFNISPEYSDRSWPPVRDSLKPSSYVADLLNRTISSGKILDLGIFDVAKVREYYALTIHGSEDHSVFLNQLLTIEKGLLEHL